MSPSLALMDESWDLPSALGSVQGRVVFGPTGAGMTLLLFPPAFVTWKSHPRSASKVASRISGTWALIPRRLFRNCIHGNMNVTGRDWTGGASSLEFIQDKGKGCIALESHGSLERYGQRVVGPGLA